MVQDRSDDTPASVGTEKRSRWRFPWRRAPRPLVPVLLFKTERCPLCDEAEELLRREADRLGLELQICSGVERPDLLEKHAQEAPVVLIAGVLRFRGRVSKPLLVREVEAARRAARS